MRLAESGCKDGRTSWVESRTTAAGEVVDWPRSCRGVHYGSSVVVDDV
jgi:hypothetical protein